MNRSSADVRLAVKLGVMVRGFWFVISSRDHFHQGREFLLDFSHIGFHSFVGFSTFEVGPHYLVFPPTSLRFALTVGEGIAHWE